MRIGVTCYPTVGGSGVIATELGLALARRGHQVHFVCYALPYRLGRVPAGVTFHEVTFPNYPLFQHPPYSLALASHMADVAVHYQLDLLHVHYAIPHAVSALLAKAILGNGPPLVVTLHGTDITVVGADPAFLPVLRWALEKADAVTAVSQALAEQTMKTIGSNCPIRVIPNFVDLDRCDPSLQAAYRKRLSPDGAPVLVHASNFRPVKRVLDVVAVFQRVYDQLPCHLAMIGDGPERPAAERAVREAGLAAWVDFLGNVSPVEGALGAGDIFLLTSEEESFGLAALEAMACGVPVVATAVGGVPEVIKAGEGGFLFPLGDVEGMALQVVSLLRDFRELAHQRQLARQRAQAFAYQAVVDRYEALYREVLTQRSGSLDKAALTVLS